MNRTSPIDRPRSSNRLPRILLVLAAALAHTASAQASRQARPSDVFLAQHPQPTSYLTDAADMVSATDERFLEVELYRLECRYGAQMGVVTVATTGTQPIEEFSLAVASRWRFGRATHNDGVILVIARDDRRLRIEIGTGLEKTMPQKWLADDPIAAARDQLRKGDAAEAIAQAIKRVESRLPRLEKDTCKPPRLP